MEVTRYCICCSGEVKMNFGFRYKEMICPHCSAILRYKKTLSGKQIYEGRYAGETTCIKMVALRGKHKNV